MVFRWLSMVLGHGSPKPRNSPGSVVQGIAFVVFDSAMAARRACGLSGEMFKAHGSIRLSNLNYS